MKRLIEQLKADEGYRKNQYKDSLGKWTIGIGYCVTANPLKLSAYELEDMRINGCSEAKAELLLMRVLENNAEAFKHPMTFLNKLDDVRHDVLLNMSYQLGVAGVLKFKNMLIAIEHSDYEHAATCMIDSLWAKQTPNRAHRLAEQMKTGRYA